MYISIIIIGIKNSYPLTLVYKMTTAQNKLKNNVNIDMLTWLNKILKS